MAKRSSPNLGSVPSWRWCDDVVESHSAGWPGELGEIEVPGRLGHGAPLLALGADLIRSFASAGESCVATSLHWPAGHACTCEMRDRCVDGHAHTAADGEPVDEDDAASLVQSEEARRPSGWQPKRPHGLESSCGGRRPMRRGRSRRLHRKQDRYSCDHGATETQSSQRHHRWIRAAGR